MKHVVYLTPNLAFTTDKFTNPYISDLAAAWEEQGATIIRSKYGYWLRTLDFAIYLLKANIIMLNWPEDLYHSPLGQIQVWLLKKLLKFFKWRGGKVVYTLHNKESHNTRRAAQKHKLNSWLQQKADLIVVHSKEGIPLVNDPIKCFYFPHPFRLIPEALSTNKLNNKFTYDAMIWGNIVPYKGIDIFLQSLHKVGLQDCFKLLICGRCNDKSYWNKLNNWKTSSITLVNKHIPDEELASYFQQSRVILFTHAGESVLTSGVLAESLSRLKTVIAPNRGNFKDFANKGIVYTYNSFEEIPALLKKSKSFEEFLIPESLLKKAIGSYSWTDYVKALSGRLNGVTNPS